MQHRVRRILGIVFVVGIVVASLETPSLADEDPTGVREPDDVMPMDEDDVRPGSGLDGAMGSNPLASVSKIDFIWTHRETPKNRGVGEFGLFDSTMLHERVRLNLELHYAYTDVTRSNERDWQSVHVRPVWFVLDKLVAEGWGMRVAAGAEYVRDFSNEDKGIGTGSDLIGPLLGLGFMNRESKLVLLALMQHSRDLDGSTDISTTALRLTALRPVSGRSWLKADLKVPYDWENRAWPANLEAELGTMLSRSHGVLAQGFAGVGGDRVFDWGIALGVRVNF